MARAVQASRQRLGESQSKSARFSAPRFNQTHAEKTMQSSMISPDRLLEFLHGMTVAAASRYWSREFGSALHASHRHRMAKPGSRMGIDRDLRDLAGRELVGALYFE